MSVNRPLTPADFKKTGVLLKFYSFTFIVSFSSWFFNPFNPASECIAILTLHEK
jgi:hypothetical protein